MISAIRYIILVFILWVGQLFHATAPVSSVSNKGDMTATASVSNTHQSDSITCKSITGVADCNAKAPSDVHRCHPCNAQGPRCLAHKGVCMKRVHHCGYCFTAPVITDTLISDPLSKKPVKGHS